MFGYKCERNNACERKTQSSVDTNWNTIRGSVTNKLLSPLGHENFVSKTMNSEKACLWIQMHKIVKEISLLFLDAFSLDKLWIS